MYPGRNRQSGEHNNSSEKDNKNEGTVTNNDRNAGESGRGRGSRDDRWSDRKPGGRGADLLLACLKMTILCYCSVTNQLSLGTLTISDNSVM